MGLISTSHDDDDDGNDGGGEVFLIGYHAG